MVFSRSVAIQHHAKAKCAWASTNSRIASRSAALAGLIGEWILNVLSLVRICTKVRECSIICTISRRLLRSFAPVLSEFQINPRVQTLTEPNRQFEYAVISGQDNDVPRGVEDR